MTSMFLCLLLPMSLALRVFLTQSEPPQAGILNETTGELSLMPIHFPGPPRCGGWNLGDNGTRGQTSAVFDLNGSWFILAQGRDCISTDAGIVAPPPTVLFAVAGPFAPKDSPRVSVLAPLTTSSALRDMSVSWDYTCNVVVITREQGEKEVVYATNQVSEYDGQQRFQANYTVEPVECGDDCWIKVGGIGGIDGAAANIYQQGDMEWNCGDACVFYSLEEHMVNKKPTFPRSLIGRSFRTGKLMVNITDSFQMQTMTYVPTLKAFLGIGKCCTETWCDSACKGIPDQDLVVVQYSPQTQSLDLKAHLGPEQGEDPTSTTRLGVEVTPQFKPTPQAFVLYNNDLIAFALPAFATRTIVPVKGSSLIGAWAQSRS